MQMGMNSLRRPAICYRIAVTAASALAVLIALS